MSTFGQDNIPYRFEGGYDGGANEGIPDWLNLDGANPIDLSMLDGGSSLNENGFLANEYTNTDIPWLINTQAETTDNTRGKLKGHRVEIGHASPPTPATIVSQSKNSVGDILAGKYPYARIANDWNDGTEGAINFGSEQNTNSYKATPWRLAQEQKVGLPENYQALSEKFPQKWRPLFLKMLGKNFRNGGGRVEANDLMNAPAIMLSNTKTREGCVYVNGEIMEFPIISNGNSIRGVTKYTSLRISDNPKGDASVTGSSTVMGAALTGSGLSAKWVHGVDPVRMGGGRTAGCIGLNTYDMVRLGQKLVSRADLSSTRYRAGKKHKRSKSGLHTEAGNLSVYNLNYPVVNYTV